MNWIRFSGGWVDTVTGLYRKNGRAMVLWALVAAVVVVPAAAWAKGPIVFSTGLSLWDWIGILKGPIVF